MARAYNLLHLGDLEGAGINIQQATEKYLKGYLLAQGWELRRIHDLETLLNEAMAYDSSFEEFRGACQKINQYYLEERYPFIIHSDLNESEINESLNSAEKIMRKIREAVER